MEKGTQKVRHSIAEAVINQVASFILAVCGQLVIFPIFGIEVDMVAHVQIALFFGVIMIVKTFIIRRVFNRHFN